MPFLFHILLLSHGFLEGTRRGSRVGRATAPLVLIQMPMLPRPPGAQTSALRLLFSPCGFCLPFSDPPRSPCPLPFPSPPALWFLL